MGNACKSSCCKKIRYGQNIFLLAAEYNFVAFETILKLLAKYANQKTLRNILFAIDASGRNVLHVAAKNSNASILNTLLEFLDASKHINNTVQEGLFSQQMEDHDKKKRNVLDLAVENNLQSVESLLQYVEDHSKPNDNVLWRSLFLDTAILYSLAADDLYYLKILSKKFSKIF